MKQIPMTGYQIGLGSITKPINEITVKEAYALYEKDKAVFVDVRMPSEYKDGHIKGSILHTLAKLEDTVGKIPKGKMIVVYCRSDRRSTKASELLAMKGFNYANMVGGIRAWKEAEYPIV